MEINNFFSIKSLTSLLLSARAPVPDALAFSAMATKASSSNFSFAYCNELGIIHCRNKT